MHWRTVVNGAVFRTERMRVRVFRLLSSSMRQAEELPIEVTWLGAEVATEASLAVQDGVKLADQMLKQDPPCHPFDLKFHPFDRSRLFSVVCEAVSCWKTQALRRTLHWPRLCLLCAPASVSPLTLSLGALEAALESSTSILVTFCHGGNDFLILEGLRGVGSDDLHAPELMALLAATQEVRLRPCC